MAPGFYTQLSLQNEQAQRDRTNATGTKGHSGGGALPATQTDRGPIDYLQQIAGMLSQSGDTSLANALALNYADTATPANRIGQMESRNRITQAVTRSMSPDPSNSALKPTGRGGFAGSGWAAPGGPPPNQRPPELDYGVRRQQGDFNRGEMGKDLALQLDFKNRDRQSLMQLLHQYLTGRGATDRATSEQIVNNAGRYEPRTVHSTETRSMLPQLIQLLSQIG